MLVDNRKDLDNSLIDLFTIYKNNWNVVVAKTYPDGGHYLQMELPCSMREGREKPTFLLCVEHDMCYNLFGFPSHTTVIRVKNIEADADKDHVCECNFQLKLSRKANSALYKLWKENRQDTKEYKIKKQKEEANKLFKILRNMRLGCATKENP